MSKLYGYIIAFLAVAGAFLTSYMSGRSAGKDSAEKESIEALMDVQAETSAQAQTEQEKINAIHKADHSSIDPSKLN